ncbi:MAG: hypothetical protein ABI675_23630 [Chitinophagaceae bacterium]
MNTNKFLVGGIIGGIVNFFLGWLVWGTLLMSFMQGHATASGKAAMRTDENMIWWALIAANLLIGFLLSYILSKAGAASAAAGATIGAVVGLLTSASIDLFNYAFMDLSDSMVTIVVDVLATIVVSAIVGAIIGWYNGRGVKATA